MGLALEQTKMNNTQNTFIQSLRDQIRVRIGRTVYRIKMIAEWAEIEESDVWALELDTEDIDFIFLNFIK